MTNFVNLLNKQDLSYFLNREIIWFLMDYETLHDGLPTLCVKTFSEDGSKEEAYMFTNFLFVNQPEQTAKWEGFLLNRFKNHGYENELYDYYNKKRLTDIAALPKTNRVANKLAIDDRFKKRIHEVYSHEEAFGKQIPANVAEVSKQ